MWNKKNDRVAVVLLLAHHSVIKVVFFLLCKVKRYIILLLCALSKKGTCILKTRPHGSKTPSSALLPSCELKIIIYYASMHGARPQSKSAASPAIHAPVPGKKNTVFKPHHYQLRCLPVVLINPFKDQGRREARPPVSCRPWRRQG